MMKNLVYSLELYRTSWLIVILLLTCIERNFYIREIGADIVADPKFSAPIANVTVTVGREALLTCVVQDLGSYKVAWLRVDTQTILTIQNHVITKNQRIGITYAEHKTWQLKIKDIKESDRGWYMCQINTDPMKSQMGYLDVVVPPDILDSPASSDRMEKEGTNVTLKCAATGSPEPTITWRREKGELIELPNGSHEASVTGSTLVFPRVKRQHMGAYLCIASNGVPPSVSKRIKLTVHFPPMITVQNQLIGAVEGKGVTLECQSEAYPRAINYWTRERGGIVPPGGHYTSNVTIDSEYRSTMKLHIYPLTDEEFGTYRCVAKNSLGDTDGTIKLYRIPPSAVNYLENHEGRGKGKKRLKTSELYHPSKSIEVVGETENSGKWKDVIPRNTDENIYASSTANSRWPRITVKTSIVNTAILTLLSISTFLVVL